MGTNGKIILLGLVALFAVLAVFSPATVFANTGNVTINVTIQSLTEITVSPFNLTWYAITPSTVGGERNVTVQNSGSTNATNLYAFMTTIENETARPYAGGYAGDYSAGGVLVFRNSTTASNMSWAGRLEWNWTEKIASTDWSNINSGIQGIKAEGFLRNTTVQFYWAAANGTVDSANPNAGFCNNTGALLAMSDQIDNGTSLTRSPTTTSITWNSGDENWSYFSVNRASNPLYKQCVALYVNCTKIFVYNYDKRASGGFINGNSCTNADYITAGPLTPSQFEKVTADIWMPKGIPAGFMKIATWTFVVT